MIMLPSGGLVSEVMKRPCVWSEANAIPTDDTTWDVQKGRGREEEPVSSGTTRKIVPMESQAADRANEERSCRRKPWGMGTGYYRGGVVRENVEHGIVAE